MAMSDFKVTSGRAAVNAIADEPTQQMSVPLQSPPDGDGTHAASPSRAISDRALTLLQIST